MRPSRVSEDVIGNTYIYLIERFASDSSKKAGEFFTPLKITELIAKLVRPKPDIVNYDRATLFFSNARCGCPC